jgi:shikimate kinase
MSKRNIVLVGFMGTGKTTVGRLLSEQTGMPLVDMDERIEKRAGKSINQIFAEEGEKAFRSLERKMAQELSTQSGQIISTGGGIVLNPDNISDFEKNGLVVCLLASAETILERVKNDDSRPLLAGEKQEKIIQLLETRRPLYEAIGHKIDTEGTSPHSVAAQIVVLYETNLEIGR